MIPGSWDRAPHRAPCSLGSLLLPPPLSLLVFPLWLCLSVKQINKILKKDKRKCKLKLQWDITHLLERLRLKKTGHTKCWHKCGETRAVPEDMVWPLWKRFLKTGAYHMTPPLQYYALLTRKGNISPDKQCHPNVHTSFISNSPKLETVHISINR